MDYYHYQYQCPYISGTTQNQVFCDGGCRINFPSIAACRRWIRKYCADPDGWKACTISQMQTEQIEFKLEIQKEVKSWRTKKKI